MNLDIKPIHYHDTISEDGITHHVIIGERKTGYHIYINKTFWECECEDTAKLMLIEELKILKKQLETELNERYTLRKER